MAIGSMTPDELRDAGMRALVEGLGAPDALRFLQLIAPGKGDYTAERAAAIDRGEYDDFMREVEAEASAAPAEQEADRELVGAGVK